MRNLIVVIFAFLLLTLSSSDVSACSCAGQQIPCQAYGQASAVFVGTVITSRIVTTKRGEYDTQDRVVRFLIDSAFRGVESGEVEVTTGLGGGDCGFGFQQSKQYLVYAYEYEGKLATSICSRTRPTSDASEDLKFLRSLARAPHVSSITGGVLKSHRNETGGVNPQPLSGITVTIEGPRNGETKTDASGKYRFENLPAGDYTVKVSVPEGLSTRGEPVEKVKAVDGACAVANFWLDPDGQISGRVLNPQGLPVSKVEIFILEADKERYRGYFEIASSDEEGGYRFKQVPPGRYVLSVRFDGMTSQDRPFPTTYFPGVSEKSQATVIALKEGQRIDKFDIELPPLPLESEIEGQVLWSDGKPEPAARVGYSGVDPIIYGVTVDKDGRFRLKAYNGLRLSLNASIEPEKGKYIQSNYASVLVGPGLEPVKLILPRP